MGYTLAAFVRLDYRRFVHYWKRTANMMLGTFYVNRIEVCRWWAALYCKGREEDLKTMEVLVVTKGALIGYHREIRKWSADQSRPANTNTNTNIFQILKSDWPVSLPVRNEIGNKLEILVQTSANSHCQCLQWWCWVKGLQIKEFGAVFKLRLAHFELVSEDEVIPRNEALRLQIIRC